MLPFDPTGKHGVKTPIPDNVVVRDPKVPFEEEEEIRSVSQQKPEQLEGGVKPDEPVTQQ